MKNIITIYCQGWMIMNKVQFGFSEPLNEGDTENTTLGCRHTNPDICGSNSNFAHKF